jgi:hypothetical protein
MLDRFLGIVDFIATGKTRVGKLRAIVAIREDGVTEALSQEAQDEQFPNTGRASWYKMPLEVSQGTLWWFTTSESPTFDQHKPTHDLMQVDSPIEAKEVIDCCSLGDLNTVRQVLTGRGFGLHHTPSHSVYLWVQGDQWIGPVTLEPHPSSANHWRISPMMLQDHSLPLGAASEPESVVCANARGHSLLIVAPNARITSSSVLDWATDDILLKRVLRWIRSKAPAFTDDVRLTQQTIDHMVDRLKEAGLGSNDGNIHHHRLERARAIVAELGQRATLVEQIISDVLHLPQVNAVISEKVQDLATAERERAVASVADALATRKAELAELEVQIGRKWEELNETEQLITDEQEKIESDRQRLRDEADILEARREALRQEFEARVQKLVAEPGALLADLAILRLVAPALQASPELPGSTKRSVGSSVQPGGNSDATDLEMIVSGDRHDTETESSASAVVSEQDDGEASVGVITCGYEPPISQGLPPQGEPFLDTLHESRRAIRKACRAAGVSASCGLAVHASLLAGLCPVVAGADALDLLEAYAQVTTGGRLCWVPISPTILDPLDLLGRPNESGRMIQHPSGLLDLLVNAESEPNTLTLVVLDGITHAPADTYLTPVLAWQATAHRGADARQFPLCHATALAADDAFSKRTKLRWPSNVLLAATLGQGPTMLLPSIEFWSRAAFIPLTQHALESRDGSEVQEATSTRSSVQMSRWTAWRHEVLAANPGQLGELLELFPAEFGLARDSAGERLMAALMALLGPPPSPQLEIKRALCLARIIPHAVAANTWNLGEDTFEALAKEDAQLGPAIRHALNMLSGEKVRL